MSQTRTITRSALLLITFIVWRCSQAPEPVAINRAAKDSLTYLNHSDTARYVGMNTCRLCHQDIYETFIKTGMGRSFAAATKSKSAADFTRSSLYDRFSDFHYRAYWSRDSLFVGEFRLAGADTQHRRTEQVNYIIGSGQHTNSHLRLRNGYLCQMPMTFYTQKGKWDLPPGFENGVNTRFSRKIGLECMTCHNAYPDLVAGSENKYTRLPEGIDCERCHGPGSIHVAQRSTGSRVDTARFIDYSIVNPAKLSINAQFDICQRCHLQGNAVVKEGKSFYDFRPGQQLSDFISVFLSKYSNADEEFIMASHADRLKQSACFIQSYARAGKKNLLRPYKEAMTCVTCHNPHVSVRETNANVFNDACNRCHVSIPVGHPALAKAADDPQRLAALRKAKCGLRSTTVSNCVSCHMPVSGSVDIPHVTVHDHYIRKPISQKEKEKIKTFLGLFSVNERAPDALTRAKAYINQYDKFDANPCFLDSAARLLASPAAAERNCYALLHLHFIRRDFRQIVALVNQLGDAYCYSKKFIRKSYDNADAWAAYRVAEAYTATGNTAFALRWFERSVSLAPFNSDFRNKYASALAGSQRFREARQQFAAILQEAPDFVPAYTNLGYLLLSQGQPAEALKMYTLAEKLDPDNEPLLLNLAGYYLAVNNREAAKRYLERILRKNATHQKARAALQQLMK